MCATMNAPHVGGNVLHQREPQTSRKIKRIRRLPRRKPQTSHSFNPRDARVLAHASQRQHSKDNDLYIIFTCAPLQRQYISRHPHDAGVPGFHQQSPRDSPKLVLECRTQCTPYGDKRLLQYRLLLYSLARVPQICSDKNTRLMQLRKENEGVQKAAGNARDLLVETTTRATAPAIGQ